MYKKIYKIISEWKIYKKLDNIRFLKPYLSEKGLLQFIKYVIIGCLTAFLELFLLWIFNEYIFKDILKNNEWRKIFANTSGTIIAFCCNFILNRKISFGSNGKAVLQFIKYIALFLFNLIITDAFIYIFSVKIGINYMIVKLFTMVIIIMWNFILYKKFIFKEAS